MSPGSREYNGLIFRERHGVLFVVGLTCLGPKQFVGHFFIYCMKHHYVADDKSVWILVFRYSVETGIHTEQMPGGLALIIPLLQERHAGNYTCTANYANTESLSKSVLIRTFGESCTAKSDSGVTTSLSETTQNDHLIK